MSFFNSNIIYPIQRNLALLSIISHSYYFCHKSYRKHDLEFLTSKRKYDHVSELWSLCRSLRILAQHVLQCAEYRHTRIDGRDLLANLNQIYWPFYSFANLMLKPHHLRLKECLPSLLHCCWQVTARGYFFSISLASISLRKK